MPKKQEQGCVVVDCMHGYIPREHEVALAKGALIREPGKSGKEKEQGKLQKPRLKHRPDGRKYVDANGWSGDEPGQGIVKHPKFINPGKSSIIKTSIEALWATFQDGQLDGIVGSFNTEPIREYMGLEKNLNDAPCLLTDECGFAGKFCSCIWRPFQLLVWGCIVDGQFTALPDDKIIRSSWLTMYELRDKVRELLTPEQWTVFRNKLSKKYSAVLSKEDAKNPQVLDDIAAHKLIDNLQTMQRTDFSTANCYGLALHQFGLAIETRYADSDGSPCKICGAPCDLLVCLAVNERNPVVETKRQAIHRLAQEEQKKQPKKEQKEEKPKLVVKKSPVSSVENADEGIFASTYDDDFYDDEEELVGEIEDSIGFDDDEDNF